MAWSIGPLTVAAETDVATAIEERFGQIVADDDPDRTQQRDALKLANRIAQTMVDSVATGDPPFEVSVAVHPAVARSGSRPYVSVSVVGSSPEEPLVHEPQPVERPERTARRRREPALSP
jgi:hypothetical protein